MMRSLYLAVGLSVASAGTLAETAAVPSGGS